MQCRTSQTTQHVVRALFWPNRWRYRPLSILPRGTRFRWVSGLTIRNLRLHIPQRAHRCAPMNMDAVLVDVRRIRRAKRKALAQMVKDGYRRCDGCHKWIDPDICGCGDPITHNAFAAGHMPVPMGCDCLREPSVRMLKDVSTFGDEWHGYETLNVLAGEVLQKAEYTLEQDPVVRCLGCDAPIPLCSCGTFA